MTPAELSTLIDKQKETIKQLREQLRPLQALQDELDTLFHGQPSIAVKMSFIREWQRRYAESILISSTEPTIGFRNGLEVAMKFDHHQDADLVYKWLVDLSGC